MKHPYALLLALGIAFVGFAMLSGSAQPCLAASCQEPPPDEPGVGNSEMSEDEPPPDEPPFDEPPPDIGERPRRPGGFGPGRGHKGPGCSHKQDGSDDGEARKRCDEMCQRFLELIKDKLPEHYERLKGLQEKDPREFDRIMWRLRPVVREYLDLVQDEPELAATIFEDFRTDEQLRELSVEYRIAKERNDKGRMTQLEAKIRELVEKQARSGIARREARLRITEKRLKQQMERLQRHRERFEEEKARITEFVDDRVKDVMEGKPPRDKPRHGKGGRFKRGEHGRKQGQVGGRGRGGEGRRDKRQTVREGKSDTPEAKQEPDAGADE